MESKLIVGTLAELHKVKGLDVLLCAWAKFIKRYPEAELKIFGTGEEEENLKALAKELNIEVKFMGYVPDAREKMNDFDIFVLPSRSEAMPYAVLEAGKVGLPVIATRVGGIPEIIENGENGVVIEPGSSETLFSSLLLLAENKELRNRLGEKLKETILKNFSLEKMVEQTLVLYR